MGMFGHMKGSAQIGGGGGWGWGVGGGPRRQDCAGFTGHVAALAPSPSRMSMTLPYVL